MTHDDKIIGDPTYYELISNISLSKLLYYPIIVADCQLITYKVANLVNPKSIPLCQYYYAGTRKFMIGDDEYAVYDIDKRQLDQRSRLLHQSGSIYNYRDIQWWLGKVPNHYIKERSIDGQNSTKLASYMTALNKIESGIEDYKRICIYKC